MGVHYLSRDEWQAGAIGAGHAAPHSQFTGLAIHHTVMVLPDYDRDGFLNGDLDDICRYMRQLQVSRPDLGLEVPYSFVVFLGATDNDCVVAEGRGFGRTGAHTVGFNSSRYGVAFAGNASVSPATDGVVDGIRWVGSALADPAGANPTFGHRDVKATECPGNHLYARLGELQPPFTRTPLEEDDMPYSEDQLLALMERAVANQFSRVGSSTRRALDPFIESSVREVLAENRGDLVKAVNDDWTHRAVTVGSGVRRGIGTAATSQASIDLQDPDSALYKTLVGLGVLPAADEPANEG